MHLQRPTLLPLFITAAVADFQGPTYPAPFDLTSDESLIPTSWANLTATFDAYFKNNQTKSSESLAGAEDVTFSIGLFSILDPAVAQLQYHYTFPEITNATQGAHRVDGDSIYRMSSVSKVFTVFAGLLELTDEDWNRPLSNITGLADYAWGEKDPAYTIQWDKITLWALASQLSGVPHECIAPADLLYRYEAAPGTGLGTDPVTTYGFPPLDINKLGPCWDIKKSTLFHRRIHQERRFPASQLPPLDKSSLCRRWLHTTWACNI
jgi:hypothetical protein